MTTTGEPCWISLYTADVDTAISFYGDLFGWSAGEPSEEFGGYRMFLRGDQPIAGLMSNDTDQPSAWAVYLQTPDVKATVDKATARGARLTSEVMPIADLGSMADMVDPAGAPVGAWQPGTFPGFVTRGEDNAPAWFEELSTSYDDSVAFYRDAFGWETETMSDTAEFRYTTLGKDQDARAGIMDATGLLGDQPSRWQLYIQVADADETVAKAVANGAEVLRAAEDTPYGRMATLKDPSGISFCVLQARFGG
ncbi:MAG: VOC family protein [Nocardioides sp.]|nr:VOC family protein [Nocardioides sp.]